MLTLTELLVQVVDALDRGKVPFFLIGGLAASAWVTPRATKDMDIVLRVRRRDGPRLKRALVDAGAHATGVELRILLDKRFVRLKTGGPLLDVRICSSAHDVAAFEHAPVVELFGRKLRVAAPEDLVLYKVQAWRPHDQLDILAILRDVRKLGFEYIEGWLEPIAEDTGTPMRERWLDIRGKAKASPRA